MNPHCGRGDSAINVRMNRERFFAAIRIDEEDVVFTKQVHSNIVNVIKNSKETLVGDGMVTRKQGVFLGLFTADCIAVFLYSSEFPVIGLIHIGRKGAERHIARKAVEKICKTFNLKSLNIEALFGPSIGPCCYEVGKDFEKRYKAEYLIKEKKHLYLDMWKMVKKQLNDSGLEKVFVPEICSYSRSDLFFSYRKYGERVGENLGIIGIEK